MHRVGIVLLGIAAGICAGCPAAPTVHPAPPAHQFKMIELVGGWRWMLRTTEAGTTRFEDEHWRLRPSGTSPNQLVGRYVRSVEVRSDDRLPFQCNQRPWYRQRAVFDVNIDLTPTGFVIHETDYHAEPSPCDHGFRHVDSYTAQLAGDRLLLRWPGGTQTLVQTDEEAGAELPVEPWPATPTLAGPWRWDATSYDDDGNIRDESEWWEIASRTQTRIDITYRRRVTVRSPDGKPIACANGPSWSFDDAYVLDGQREEEHWRFQELAAEPGSHPCLQATPKRSLDEATAEQLGDYLVLEWRGKRRQILYRPE
ncbi:MAG: hypothetical protein H6Q90_1799 [Deltaproteobacteria bacterium]|nr:hypothetical protein [Deltaproteobacteria bacterium]